MVVSSYHTFLYLFLKTTFKGKVVIKDFLTDSTMRVCVEGQWSEVKRVLFGVPQVALTIALSLAVARHAVRVDTWLCEFLRGQF